MDVLVRQLSDEDVAAADQQAKARGVSRNAYLRQLIHDGVQVDQRPIQDEDWQRFAQAASDLDDEGVMKKAWS